jgi:signal peptidase I
MLYFDILLILCGVILLALICIRTCLILITVHGQSMAPALEQGDRVLALRFFPRGWIRRGCIVLVNPANQGRSRTLSVLFHIKRVVALEGEIFAAPSGELVWQIPRRHLFVCGDNREQSIDSRTWGPLPLQSVSGLIFLRLPRKSSRPFPHLNILLNPGLPVGHVAPPFKARTLNGETVTLSHYQGQNILLLFFTVSELMRKHMSSYLALAAGAAAHQASILLVSSSDMDTTRAFAEELHIPLPVLVAPFETNSFFHDYHISSTPSYCFITAEGEVQRSGRADDSLADWRSFVASWKLESGGGITAQNQCMEY